MKGSDHCYVEHRTLNDPSSLAWDLARHMYTRVGMGKIMIFTEQPEVMLPLLQKKLTHLCRQVQIMRFATDNATLVAELTRQIVLMQQLQLTTLMPIDCPGARAFIMRPEDFNDVMPYFNTLYVTCAVSSNTLDRAVDCMPERSLVVKYV